MPRISKRYIRRWGRSGGSQGSFFISESDNRITADLDTRVTADGDTRITAGV